jgi:hypothetical protein
MKLFLRAATRHFYQAKNHKKKQKNSEIKKSISAKNK